MEQWKQIAGFPDYEASTMGRIRRLPSGRVMVNCYQTSGYQKVTLRRNPLQKTLLVHRIVAAVFISEIPAGIQVNHINGDKRDNRLENLELVTPKDNLLHAQSILGVAPVHPGIGSKHHSAKLTEEDVLEIRRLYADGARPGEIAPRFGIVRTAIYPIINRRTWRHI